MYRHVADMIIEDIKLVLKATRKTVDPWQYNVPTGTDIAVIIPTESPDIPSNKMLWCIGMQVNTQQAKQ